jgi:hypothetical protein
MNPKYNQRIDRLSFLDNIEKIGYTGSNSPHKAKKKFTAACNLWRQKIKHKQHKGPADF